MMEGVTYHKGVETFFHAHIVSFLKVTEIQLFFLIFKIMVGKLVETGRHLRGCLDHLSDSETQNLGKMTSK